MRRAYLKLMNMYLLNFDNKYGIDYLFEIEANNFFFFGEM